MAVVLWLVCGPRTGLLLAHVLQGVRGERNVSSSVGMSPISVCYHKLISQHGHSQSCATKS